jgi:hypothetical protein
MNKPERERRLDQIRIYSEHLDNISKGYQRLLQMSESDASDAFLLLTETAGYTTIDALKQLGTLLDILYRTQNKNMQHNTYTKNEEQDDEYYEHRDNCWCHDPDMGCQ